MNSEDTHLITLAQQDPNKFEKLYTKYSDKVFNYFWYRSGHDKMLAEDLMQETFLRAFKHLKHFTVREYSYLTYLISIAHNVLIDYYRKPKSVPLESTVEIPYEITDDILKRSDAETLWRAIEELPPTNRDQLLMKYQQNMSIKDIATATGTTENAVKLSLSRTRKKLKQHKLIKELANIPAQSRTPTRAKFISE